MVGDVVQERWRPKKKQVSILPTSKLISSLCFSCFYIFSWHRIPSPPFETTTRDRCISAIDFRPMCRQKARTGHFACNGKCEPGVPGPARVRDGLPHPVPRAEREEPQLYRYAGLHLHAAGSDQILGGVSVGFPRWWLCKTKKKYIGTIIGICFVGIFLLAGNFWRKIWSIHRRSTRWKQPIGWTGGTTPVCVGSYGRWLLQVCCVVSCNYLKPRSPTFLFTV